MRFSRPRDSGLKKASNLLENFLDRTLRDGLLIFSIFLSLHVQSAEPGPNPVLGTASSGTQKPGKIAIWTESAERGENWARFNLGLAYHLGQEVPRNPVEAVKWYQLAASDGYAPAQANLGYCYETGFGVEINPAQAVSWYQLSAVQGNAFAQYNLAKKYLSGPGVALNPKEAEKWFRSAASQNFVPAFFSLGQIFANEFSGNTNYSEAIKWFRLGAEQNYAPAQHAIGYLYFSGKGVQTNYVEATKWFTMAASQNFPDSDYNLGYCFENGLGKPQNLITAVNHYRTAAEAGHPQAQYSLGVCYYEGKGVQVDYVQAYKWWNLAAVQGISEANASREILGRLMPDSRIKEAQKLASEFIPKNRGFTESTGLLQTASAEATDVKRVATAFLIATNGFLATNFRMLANATNLIVITESGSFPAEVYRTDPLNDLAILKVEGAFQSLPLGSSRDASVDSDLICLGFDGQTTSQFSPKIARGKILSSLGFNADPRQFSLGPQLPNSFAGAAILNRKGQVIGLTLPELQDTTIPDDPTKPQPPRNSFALKSDHILSFLKDLTEIKITSEEPKAPQSPEEIISRARGATALVVVM